MTSDVFVFPASFAQQRLWFLDQLLPDNAFYKTTKITKITKSPGFFSKENLVTSAPFAPS